MKNPITTVTQHPFIQERPAVRQFMKFGIVGVMNTIIDYLIFSGLVYLFHVYFLIANVISFSVAVMNSYIFNRRWTFRSDNPAWRKEATKFLAVNLIGLGLSEVLLSLFVHGFDLSKLLAKALAVVVVLCWNFVGTKLWAFRRPPADLPG